MSNQTSSPIEVYVADSDESFNHIFNIRTTVFVDEESIDDEDEYDGFDHLANHYLALYEGIPVGT
ncbi:MAG: GNAT family N-acetyltransferase, partial [Bacteroidota bacterium]